VTTAIGVVVPVHDEEQLLDACLRSLEIAARRARLLATVHVVVVLDACTDGSARIAENYGKSGDFEIVEIAERNVGRGRAIGMTRVLEHFASLDRSDLWLATTDADSTVPRSWLTDHLALASTGAGAVAGVVRIRPEPPFPLAHFRAFMEFYDALGDADQHGHVHGANLGVRADAYLAVGGFAPLRTGEDQALVQSLRHANYDVLATRELEVVTSARLVGRAPEGFAQFLASRFA